MTRVVTMSMTIAAAAVALAAAGPALAQTTPQPPAPPSTTTPKDWNYEIIDGKRVPKGQRKVNADGSWREEIRQGKCVTIKEKLASGEYKETRQCDD